MNAPQAADLQNTAAARTREAPRLQSVNQTERKLLHR